MNVYIPAPILAATESLSLADRGISAAKVILTGFVVVFAVLLLLILIIKIYSTIVGKAQKASGKRAEKKLKKLKVSEGELKLEAKRNIPVPVKKTEASPESDEIPEEIVAVIAAAVDAMYGSSGRARIKSIRKSGAKRSAWANAGIIENTRPFN